MQFVGFGFDENQYGTNNVIGESHKHLYCGL